MQVGVGAIAAGIQRFGVDNYEMAYEGRKEFSSAGEYATDIAFGAAFGAVFGAAGRIGGAARATVIAEGRNFGTGLRGLGNQAKFEVKSLSRITREVIESENALFRQEISSVKNGVNRLLGGESENLARVTNSGRTQSIKDALTDERGQLLSKAERNGVKSTIRNVEELGFEVKGAIKYRGNQGIDLLFEGTETNATRFALAEAKAGSKLRALESDVNGIRQGSYEFFRTRLARAMVYGNPVMKTYYRSIYTALRSGEVDMFVGLAGNNRLFRVNQTVFQKDADFRTVPKALERVNQ